MSKCKECGIGTPKQEQKRRVVVAQEIKSGTLYKTVLIGFRCNYCGNRTEQEFVYTFEANTPILRIIEFDDRE